MHLLTLNDRHQALGATFGEFAGYRMPLYYSKPLEEHRAVRERLGVFDISHMGQFEARGEQAEAFLHHALTSNVLRMHDGQALYSPLCREDGGVLDDLIIYRHSPAHYRIIVNASNRAKDYAWLARLAGKRGVALQDVTAGHCLFAVQGPRAFAALATHVTPRPDSLPYYGFAVAQAFGGEVFMARTGYTGEPGVELAVPVAAAEAVWQALTGTLGATPIGLAARDSLRLEACMALYGHELSEQWHPFESGVGWAVDLDAPEDFCGKSALRAIKAAGSAHALVGLEVTGRGIAREGYPVLQGGHRVGVVTSGVLSPTTGKPVALAHVESAVASIGTALEVEIRGKAVQAQVVRRPFYRNPALRA
ncbi:MAG: glycine cleavage system aminomethyltransferase GcvT [Candidatus Lambdaproteobacteria bacterium]|nr:glycine cleavage system aminomethyltransferase GcvT [Candidatus Lambdaproteobacteria bacterium]